MTKIKKAIFPAAGFGTRFLPATKSIPKEMMPIIDKPLIHYAVEEAVAAGIDEIIFITGRGKQAIEDYFDQAFELEYLISQSKKDQQEKLALIREYLLEPGRIKYVRQPEPKGLGHAIWCARDFIQNEPFAVILPDDLILSQRPCIGQLREVFDKFGGNVVATMPVAPEDIGHYGIVKPKDNTAENIMNKVIELDGFVEKPSQADAPSHLAIVGRYILDGEIMSALAEIKADLGDEIQLTDAMVLLAQQQSFRSVKFEGQRYDCGRRNGWLQANIAVAMQRPDMAALVKKTLKDMNANDFRFN